MNTPFEAQFNKLQYASPVKARQILRELEGSPQELEQFCRQARRVSASRAITISRILAGGSNPEYLLLLKDYVFSNDEQLRDEAFKALSSCNNTARKEVMLELFKSEERLIRQKACEAVAGDIDSEVEQELLRLLDDPEVNVVQAVLKVLANSDSRDVLRHCEKLLEHENIEVRLQALEILGNAAARQLAVKRIAAVLQEDTDDRIRIEACRILADKAPLQSREQLVALVNDISNSDNLRQHAVRAVGRIDPADAVEVLFNLIINDRFCSLIVGECRKVIGRFDYSVVLEFAEKKFAGGGVLEQFEIVRILGMFTDGKVEEFLREKYRQSREPIVLAGLLEQLAKLAAEDIWDFVLERSTVYDSMLVAYAAVQAAGELLTPARLLEFAAILEKEPPTFIAEVVLKRLVVYGKDRGLPESLEAVIAQYIQSVPTTLSLFAIEAAGYVQGAGLVPRLLELTIDYSELEVMEELTASIMVGVGGSVSRLLDLATDTRLREVSAVISRVKPGDISGGFEQFFAQLAVKAEAKITGAQLCLTIAASRFHREYVKALKVVAEQEQAYLLYTFSSLPQSVRSSCTLDWPSFLISPVLAVRVAALKAMTDVDVENNIADVADMAFADPQDVARETAAGILRGVLNS